VNIREPFKKKSGINISIKDKIDILEGLSNLLNSWIPLTNGLKILMYQTKNKKVKTLINNIIESINKWASLKDSLIVYPKIFTNFDLSIIEMWEVTWKLWESIEIIKVNEEKNKELKSKIIWALIYPTVIISLSVIMVWIFMIFVIPKVTKMYSNAKANLPDLTRNVISISDFLQNNVSGIILWIVIFIILLITFKNNSKTKIYFDHFILKIPLFWNLIKKKILSLFTSSLWILLKSWVIINESLKITSWALENSYYEKELNKIISWVSKWIELSTLMWINDIQSWKENPLFPIELSSVIKIWEETWKLPYLLTKISNKYTKEIDNTVENIGTAIEPIVIIWVWLIVWTIIMAVMLPFFNMVNVI